MCFVRFNYALFRKKHAKTILWVISGVSQDDFCVIRLRWFACRSHDVCQDVVQELAPASPQNMLAKQNTNFKNKPIGWTNKQYINIWNMRKHDSQTALRNAQTFTCSIRLGQPRWTTPPFFNCDARSGPRLIRLMALLLQAGTVEETVRRAARSFNIVPDTNFFWRVMEKCRVIIWRVKWWFMVICKF